MGSLQQAIGDHPILYRQYGEFTAEAMARFINHSNANNQNVAPAGPGGDDRAG